MVFIIVLFDITDYQPRFVVFHVTFSVQFSSQNSLVLVVCWCFPGILSPPNSQDVVKYQLQSRLQLEAFQRRFLQ